MLMLLFRIGDSRYALDTLSVVEIIPNVQLTTIYGAHPSVTGFLTYQGRVIPVVTLSNLLGGVSKAATLSTRIILIRLDPNEQPKESAGPRLIGLIAEQVTDTLDRSHATAVEDRSTISAKPYLGEMLLYQQEIVQCLKTEHLLSSEADGTLVSPSVTAPSATIQTIATQPITTQPVVSQINDQIDKGVPVG